MDELLILTRFYLLIAMIRGADRAKCLENEHRIKVFVRNPEETGRPEFSTCFHTPVRHWQLKLPCHNMTSVAGGLMTQEVGTESCLIEIAPYPQTEHLDGAGFSYNGGN
uniref:Uncharacterized protein n=1 Tax=Populus trichocarpa TaxID=3694 RepID=U5FRS8_POPTR